MISLLVRLRDDRRGAAALMVALMLLPLLLAIGGAVDFGIAYYLRARLGHAVDSAALAIGSTIDDNVDITDRATDFVRANYPDDAIGWVHDIQVNEVKDTITVSAQATFDTFFLRLFHWPQITVGADAVVVRNIRGLEVALVLDVTGSMMYHGKMGSMRTAAEDMVNILFGDETVHPYLRVSIVPYVTAVNPGPEAFGGSTSPTPPSWWPEPTPPGYWRPWWPYAYVPFEYKPYSTDGLGWKGCVEERFGSDLMGDDNPGGFIPYASPPDDSYTDYNNDYEWYDMPNTVRYNPVVWGYGSDKTYGPNRGCPSPIVPLTDTKADLVPYIRDMQYWYGGTMSDVGMAWGRRVLSPEAPFTEGKPWNTEDWEKAIVIMTDGMNQFNGVYSGIGVRSSSNSRIGTSSTYWARRVVDRRFADVCEDIKADGILVYTVTFATPSNPLDSGTKALFRDCATDPTKWFDSPSAEDLKANFRAIAIELSKLRISR
ncbi:TadE/TadG family type IV pilus assembly protein [Roseospira goensis]|uniref:Flp pilus assembly protein TadG n=1 Tax=Roseospira goensis TaxID=391922 RepID=A0A7W6S297_9PROT|nr:TadE/TadG family type IV pilus assembly protein [Roseospira goensis]MBB4287080.1 Flp pilus assembly protein TadG [Roseospira goensis]